MASFTSVGSASFSSVADSLPAATVLSMFLVFLPLHSVAPPLRQAVADRDRLERVLAQRAILEGDLAR